MVQSLPESEGEPHHEGGVALPRVIVQVDYAKAVEHAIPDSRQP